MVWPKWGKRTRTRIVTLFWRKFSQTVRQHRLELFVVRFGCMFVVDPTDRLGGLRHQIGAILVFTTTEIPINGTPADLEFRAIPGAPSFPQSTFGASIEKPSTFF